MAELVREEAARPPAGGFLAATAAPEVSEMLAGALAASPRAVFWAQPVMTGDDGNELDLTLMITEICRSPGGFESPGGTC